MRANRQYRGTKNIWQLCELTHLKTLLFTLLPCYINLVIFGQDLTLKFYMKQVSRTSFFHLQNMEKIRKIQSRRDVEKLVHSCVTSRLYYFNSLLSCSPQNTIKVNTFLLPLGSLLPLKTCIKTIHPVIFKLLLTEILYLYKRFEKVAYCDITIMH